MTNDYISAWVWYLASAMFLLVFVWRFTQFVRSKDFRTVILALTATLLLTPVTIEQGSAYWAPAFMVALIEAITLGSAAAFSRLWVILLAMFAVVLLAIVWRLYGDKKRPISSERLNNNKAANGT